MTRKPGRPPIPLVKRFPKLLGQPLNKLRPDKCWLWQGTLKGHYPIVSVEGRIVNARRAVYELLVRPLAPYPVERLGPPWCGHPICVNPQHTAVLGEGLTPPPPLAIVEHISVDEIADLITGREIDDPELIAKDLRVPVELVIDAMALL
ncbi:MAG: hypothetical protein ACREEW_14400 [Caulobacteraceae bacterium]